MTIDCIADFDLDFSNPVVTIWARNADLADAIYLGLESRGFEDHGLDSLRMEYDGEWRGVSVVVDLGTYGSVKKNAAYAGLRTIQNLFDCQAIVVTTV